MINHYFNGRAKVIEFGYKNKEQSWMFCNGWLDRGNKPNHIRTDSDGNKYLSWFKATNRTNDLYLDRGDQPNYVINKADGEKEEYWLYHRVSKILLDRGDKPNHVLTGSDGTRIERWERKWTNGTSFLQRDDKPNQIIIKPSGERAEFWFDKKGNLLRQNPPEDRVPALIMPDPALTYDI